MKSETIARPHSYDVSRCLARSRSMAAIASMRDPYRFASAPPRSRAHGTGCRSLAVYPLSSGKSMQLALLGVTIVRGVALLLTQLMRALLFGAPPSLSVVAAVAILC